MASMSIQQNHPAALTVEIARMREEGLPLQVDIAAEGLQLPPEDEATFAGPICVQGQLTKVAEQIYFQGTVTGAALFPCSRCLEMTRNAFAVEMRAVFLPPAAVDEQEEGITLTDEIDLYVHDGVKLDLRPAVRDQTLLALPIQPLCRADCAGLCQVCGSNLNETQCTCQIEPGDPRFALLKQLSFPQSS
jgi:uncharacterized protein